MGMGRIHSSYIYVCYPVENGSNVKSIDEKLEEIPDRFIYKLDMNIHVILYKKTRFDIKREEQIRSLFKVASILPTVSAIKKKKVEEMQTSALENIEVRNDDIIALGIFKIKYEEYVSKRRHNDLILETERLKKELKDSKATNITNIMIPNIYMNVKMNSLGTEDISHYTLEDIRNAMKKSSQVEDFLANLIDKIHFDEKCPENHNIHITTQDEKPEWAICTAYKGDRWHFMESIHRNMVPLVKSKVQLIDKILEEYDSEIDDREYKKLQDYKEQIKYYNGHSEEMFKKKAADAIFSGTKTKVCRFRESIKELQ
jgi:hypothetical protein